MSSTTQVPAVMEGSFWKSYYPDAFERFPRDVAGHAMKVHHDEGLYRHLTFMDPSKSMYWFNIVTWPGSLVFQGDMGSFMFTRLDDMFEFFGAGDINPGYWAEKTPSYGLERAVKTYSSETFEATIRSMAEDFLNDHEVLDIQAFKDQVETEVLTDIGDHHTAVQAAYDFSWNGLAVFPEIHAHDFRTYTPQFLWACLAIPFAIRHYRAAKAVTG